MGRAEAKSEVVLIGALAGGRGHDAVEGVLGQGVGAGGLFVDGGADAAAATGGGLSHGQGDVRVGDLQDASRMGFGAWDLEVL